VTPTTIPVTNCASCPFYRWPTELCTLTAKARRVGPVPPAQPPDWCPLRTADRLVTLRVT
jgi:hypothetical protein